LPNPRVHHVRIIGRFSSVRDSFVAAKKKKKTKKKTARAKPSKSLVIVESPAKARTINKYLGRDYVVKSSVGHIRDLPVSGSGKKVDPKARAAAAAKTRKMPPAKREKHKKEQAKKALFARMGINPEKDWADRAEEYATLLAAADEDIAATLSAVAPNRRLLVTDHDSLGYFADRYDFEVVGVVIPGGSTLGDPSSGELAELIEEIEEAGVSAIFGETTQPSALAEAVAAELGSDVQVVSLYTGSLGEPGSGAETLIEMLQANAESIAAALG